MTYLFRPVFPISQVHSVTAITATIVKGTLEKILQDSFSIKWVNDIYKGDLKVSGILTEAVGSLDTGNFEHIIIGIGINCYPSSIPDELQGIAGAASMEAFPGGRSRIIGEITAGLHRAFSGRHDLEPESYLEDYRRSCFVIGRTVNVIQGDNSYSAKAIDIDDRFQLLVRPLGDNPDSPIITLSSGEVSLRV